MSACPACAAPLERFGTGAWRCPACTGTFVTDAALRERLTSLSRQAVIVGGSGRHDGPDRACPICAAVMHRAYFSRVAIDRCEPHGTWFDAEELADVLARAAQHETALRDGEDRARTNEGAGELFELVSEALFGRRARP